MILVDGLDLPETYSTSVKIYPDGDIEEPIDCGYLTVGKAIQIPKGHGRIADLDEVINWLANNSYVFSMNTLIRLEKALRNAPIIADSEEEDE